MKNISNNKILAIIPARYGSKSVKNKNMKFLGNKPLIYYSIKQALNSKVFCNVLVSTDNKSIAEYSKKCGAIVPFLRPKNISGDVPTEKVLIHATKWYIKNVSNIDGITCLQPTSPFRKISSIKKCVDIFKKKKNFDSVITFKKVENNRPEWMFFKNKNFFIPWINKEKKNGKFVLKKNIARQSYQKLFIPNGSIYIVRTDTLLKHNMIFGFNVFGVINEERESLDIDTKVDFEFCKFILNNYK